MPDTEFQKHTYDIYGLFVEASHELIKYVSKI